LVGFSERNMLQLFDLENVLLARVIQAERKRLESDSSPTAALGAKPPSG
jgi:hypothetical protein